MLKPARRILHLSKSASEDCSYSNLWIDGVSLAYMDKCSSRYYAQIDNAPSLSRLKSKRRTTMVVQDSQKPTQPKFPSPYHRPCIDSSQYAIRKRVSLRSLLKHLACARQPQGPNGQGFIRFLQGPDRTHSLPRLMNLSNIMLMSVKTNLQTKNAKNSAACRALSSRPT